MIVSLRDEFEIIYFIAEGNTFILHLPEGQINDNIQAKTATLPSSWP